MAKTTLTLAVDEAYSRLKGQLVQRKYKINSEEHPTKISVIQGSLWGTTPKTAQKSIKFTLEEDQSSTRIQSKSALTSGYVILTTAGVALSFALLVVCLWIALNLQAYASTGAAGFWGLLSQTHGSFDLGKAVLLTRLTWFLTAFLVATLVIETIVVARLMIRIEAIVDEVFKSLATGKTG